VDQPKIPLLLTTIVKVKKKAIIGQKMEHAHPPVGQTRNRRFLCKPQKEYKKYFQGNNNLFVDIFI
jgi:hypothetical protein